MNKYIYKYMESGEVIFSTVAHNIVSADQLFTNATGLKATNTKVACTITFR